MFFSKKNKATKFWPFMAINVYSVKPLFEELLPLVDVILQAAIVVVFLYDIIVKYKLNHKFKYEKYLVFFAFLILFNGLSNGMSSALYTKGYVQGLLNYGFIFVLCLYILNTINTREELIDILWMTRFNIILLFVFAFFDTNIHDIGRAGDVVNPNYLSQMSIILILFFIFSTENKFSLVSFLFYVLSTYTIILTGSKSGLMALMIIIGSILLFNIKSKKLIMISYYTFWGIFLFYMGVILSTANYEYGLLRFFVKAEDTSRVMLWQYTYYEFLKHPIMGELYNTFRAPWGTIKLVTHNDYLRLAVELGITGVVLLFAFGRKQMKLLLQYSNRDSLFLYSLIMVTLSYSLSHNNINNPMFWLALVIPSLKVFDLDNANMEKGDESIV
jgi:hypothetical protein